jgi:hypothetical protein
MNPFADLRTVMRRKIVHDDVSRTQSVFVYSQTTVMPNRWRQAFQSNQLAFEFRQSQVRSLTP